MRYKWFDINNNISIQNIKNHPSYKKLTNKYTVVSLEKGISEDTHYPKTKRKFIALHVKAK